MVIETIIVGGENKVLLKKSISKILYANKMEQSKISQLLGLSQPMVSNYCSSNEKISKNIEKLAHAICKRVLDGDKAHFQTCVTFSKEVFEGNYYIANKNEIIYDENSKIIDNLTKSFLELKGTDMGELQPQVKVNIAMAKENARNSDDVASFANGLVLVDGIVSSMNGIRFGKSKHLSSLLLNLQNKLGVNAIMNVAIVKEPDKTKMNYEYLSKDFMLDFDRKDIDILLHKGDFGIEPCAYILGKNAVDVVNKVIKIIEEMK